MQVLICRTRLCWRFQLLSRGDGLRDTGFA